jgi:hypothetical protein
MKLRAKKIVAYIFWPVIWLVIEAGFYLAAIPKAWSEYRYHTQGSIRHFKDGYSYIHNFQGVAKETRVE